jgi:pyruvate/2-oxoglutarate/acetoin dehydrogenase E1 component
MMRVSARARHCLVKGVPVTRKFIESLEKEAGSCGKSGSMHLAEQGIAFEGEVREDLAQGGTGAETAGFVDTSPLNKETPIELANESERALAFGEDHARYGNLAETVAMIAEWALCNLDTCVRRRDAIGAQILFSSVLENHTVPTAKMVAGAA